MASQSEHATEGAQSAREAFDAAIALVTDADQVARLELARDYFCNPAFRAALEDHVYAINQRAAGRVK